MTSSVPPNTRATSRRSFLKNSVLTATVPAIAACSTQPADNRTLSITDALVAPEGTQSQQALHHLMATVREINRSYFVAPRGFTSPADIVEGQRFLLHLLNAGTDFYLENDPSSPRFVNMVSPLRKLLGDNPDARYFFAPIYGDRHYRISGRRNGSEYIAYTVHTGGRDGNWNGPGISHINHNQMKFDKDGNYEIILGPSERGKVWLPSGENAVYIVNRHYYEHQESAAANPLIEPQLSIEPLEPGTPPKPLTDEQIAQRLRAIANFLRVTTVDIPPPTPETVPKWWSLVPNQMGEIAHFGSNQDDIGLGAIDNTYTAGLYVLQPGEALLMEGRLPRCYFANVVLWNRFLQTDDYRYRQISLNRRQMKLKRGGHYQIVVAAENPGVSNWLDTAGRSYGTVQWRFLLAEADVERPQCRVVSLEEAARLAS